MAADASPRAEETVRVSFRRFSGSDISFPSVKPTISFNQSIGIFPDSVNFEEKKKQDVEEKEKMSKIMKRTGSFKEGL